MAELPEFTQGQYGKLTSEVMNSLVSQVQQNTEFITNFGLAVPNQPRGGKGNYPIIAKIGSRILPPEKDENKFGDDDGGDDGKGGGEEGDALRTGYRWNEVFLNEESNTGSPWESASRRGYSATRNNPAYPTNGFSFQLPDRKEDPDAETTDTANFEGMVVFLFPFANNQGKSILVFQSPQTPTVFVAEIEGGGEGKEDCIDASGADPYMARRWSSGEATGEPFEVYNGCEPNGMGGKIDGAGCEMDVPIVRVPGGTRVIVTKAGNKMYFNATNERCVTCCSSEEPFQVEENTNPNAVVRTFGEEEYDPGYGSIHLEMMK